jgi:hypothetical protein
VLCPLGYVRDEFSHHYRPQRNRIPRAVEQDIDVLFYGSIDRARRDVLDALDGAGLRVQRLFGVYGAERDAYIARSKVVLNLHFYKKGVFEIFRVSHLLENRKCVVTEAGGCDAQLESFAEDACVYALRQQIVGVCVNMATDDDMRKDMEDYGFEAFKKIDFVENVRKALEASGG